MDLPPPDQIMQVIRAQVNSVCGHITDAKSLLELGCNGLSSAMEQVGVQSHLELAQSSKEASLALDRVCVAIKRTLDEFEAKYSGET